MCVSTPIRRLSASVLIAALGLILAFAMPALAAAKANADQADCYETDEGECIPFTDISENTTLFLAFHSDGLVSGTADFARYQQEVKGEYGLRIERRGDKIVIVEPEPDDNASTRAAAAPGQANFAFFYNRPDWSGPAFAVGVPDVVSDLRTVRYPDGGSWNNRISSVITRGGAGAGAILCTRPHCAISPGVFIGLPPNANIQLVGGLNNSASAVAVP